MIPPNNIKNRNRDDYTFANINLLGKCNVDCFFCLGKDIEKELAPHNQVGVHFKDWKSFPKFLSLAKEKGIKKLYITGQNTDSLLYKHLEELIVFLKDQGFGVGLRTNGYMLMEKPDLFRVANLCTESVGYSIHSLSPMTNKMIMGRSQILPWEEIFQKTNNPRVSIVLNRCNEHEFFDLLKFLAKYKNIRYVQVRRVSTDTRYEELAPDIAAYERVYTQVSNAFGPPNRTLWADAEEYLIYGQPVIFWRTVKTSVNSMNFFTNGVISDLYFIVEGFKKYYEPPKCECVHAPEQHGSRGCNLVSLTHGHCECLWNGKDK